MKPTVALVPPPAARLRPASTHSAPTPGTMEAALEAVVRRVVREEVRTALAENRAAERETDATKLVPLEVAAARYGITTKALRSRIERGSIAGASKIGGRWHVPLGTLPAPEDP